jgi:DNA (cytosine-5)-methyltransferase 1
VRSVELFAGAGGLALGCEQAGFSSRRVVERDRWASETLRLNFAQVGKAESDCELIEDDVRNVQWDDLADQIDLLAGGPPCQPFSTGGKHQAADDPRDMFPVTTDVIARLRPRAFILENVRGLTREKFKDYFQYVCLRLAFPEVRSKRTATWTEHLSTLKKATRNSHNSGLTYSVSAHLVNAADYGVPQSRHRVFIVGLRSDLECSWRFPSPSHSYEALVHSQWISGEYWKSRGIRKPTNLPKPSERTLNRLERVDPADLLLPWKTTRDGLFDLPKPSRSQSQLPKIANHVFQPGARTYPGHTGSHLDLPAKTLKAGGHGVPGGENMMILPAGAVRYFTAREAARLQTFPDDYRFSGAWGEVMRQLGNAVPVQLARLIAESVFQFSLLVSSLNQFLLRQCETNKKVLAVSRSLESSIQTSVAIRQ